MNLDELRSVLDKERESGTLQPLRPSFYQEARAFIQELAEERDRLAAESTEPFSDEEVAQLSDRLATASEVLESIYDNRVAKVLTHAATVADESEADPPPLTTEEAALYETVVEAIRSTKGAALQGETPPATSTSPAAATDDAPPPQDEDGDAEDDTAVEASASEADVERTLVRITADVGTILGTDEREYELEPGDVISLPAENATALIERSAAEPVDR